MDLSMYALPSCSSVSLLRAQGLMENMLGFSLDSSKRLDSVSGLGAGAWRLFPYHFSDAYKAIDPCSSVSEIKLVKNGIYDSESIIEISDYGVVNKGGFIKYLIIPRYGDCGCVRLCMCSTYQLAVNADWLWESGKIPNDLLSVFSEIATYYNDDNRDIRSETLGSHSYTRYEKDSPELDNNNISIIRKYAGPNGSLNKPIV